MATPYNVYGGLQDNGTRETVSHGVACERRSIANSM